MWTTFSPDQVDLNFKNERVLLRVLDILLDYVRRGADMIRLDAVTYIWRELGTRCAHLRETHALVQLFRAVLDVVAPQVAIVTETNVPHEDNVSYFGDGANEAQMVYNFALPPLVLHTFHTGDCGRLRDWAAGLRRISSTATYFNFLDSHDGIGLSGAKGILSPQEIDALVDRALAARRPRLLPRERRRHPQPLRAERHLVQRAQPRGRGRAAVAAGGPVPGLAARSRWCCWACPASTCPACSGRSNDTAAVLKGSEARSINRKTIDETALFETLRDRHSWVHEVAVRFRRLVRRRIATPAFHPNAAQRVIDAGPGVFAVRRGGAGGPAPVLALTNVTSRPQEAVFPRDQLDSPATVWRDRITGRDRRAIPGGALWVSLRPYEVLWLTPDDDGPSPAP